MQASKETIDFVKALNAKMGEVTETHSYTFDFVGGRNYDKIVHIYCEFTRDVPKQSRVHAFVDRKTGGLVKAATWKAPQKNSDGTLSVRYDLSTPEGFQKAVDSADRSGAYLYVK